MYVESPEQQVKWPLCYTHGTSRRGAEGQVLRVLEFRTSNLCSDQFHPQPQEGLGTAYPELWSQTTWVKILASSFIGSVALGQLLLYLVPLPLQWAHRIIVGYH